MDRRAARTRHPVEVIRVLDLAPHMRRIVIRGDGLATMPAGLPGQWLKVFFPCEPGAMPHGRAYTIRRHDPAEQTMDLDFVLHGDEGAASRWALRAQVGEILAVAGPREGYRIDAAAAAQLLIGDSTSLPAIAAILETLPDALTAHVLLEVTDEEETALLPARTRSHVHASASGAKAAGTAGCLEAVLRMTELPAAAQVWVAGEAGMVRRVCSLLCSRSLPRESITASGYWREGFADHRDRDEAEGVRGATGQHGHPGGV